MRNDRNRKAFTIVEMVIVIAVIAVLAAVMIPTISGVIQMANVSADKQFAASLNIQLAMESVDREILNESDLRDVINKYYGAEGEDYFETKLSPKSAKHGYYFWYDYTNKTVVVGTVEDIAELAAQTPGAATMSAVPMIGGGETFSPASLRSDLIEGYYLMGCKGGELVDLIAKFENLGMTEDSQGAGQDYEEAIKAMEQFVGDAPATGSLEAKLRNKIETTAIITEAGAFRYSDISTIMNVYIPLTVKELASTEVFICGEDGNVDDGSLAAGVNGGTTEIATGAVHFELPAGVEVNNFGLYGLGTPAVGEDNTGLWMNYPTVKVSTNLIETIFKGFPVNCVIQTPDGSRYVVMGNEYAKLPLTKDNEGNEIFIATGIFGEGTVSDKVSLGISYTEVTDKTFLDGDRLYVAYDIAGQKLQLYATGGIPASMVTWNIKDGTGLLSVNNSGEVTIEKLPELVAGTVYSEVVTASVNAANGQTKTAELEIYVVRPSTAQITLDGKTVSLSAGGSNALELIYTDDEVFSFDLSNPAIGYNQAGYVILDECVFHVSSSGNMFTVDDNAKTLTVNPSQITDEAQSLIVTYTNADGTVVYLSKTFSVTVIDNSAVSLKPNQITDTVAIGEKYLFRVGNQNAIPLSALFGAIEEGKNVEVKNVKIYNALNTSLDGRQEIATSGSFRGKYTANADWKASTVQFGGTGVAIIAVETSKGTVEVAVEVVAGKNIFAGEQLSGSSDGNYVMLGNVTLSSGGSLTIGSGKTLYGNGFTFDVKNGAHNVLGIITLSGGTLNNVVITGPVYTTVTLTSFKENSSNVVYASDGAQIVNCYISNGMAAVRVSGDATIKDSVIDGGRYANITHENGTLTLDNATTIGMPRDGVVGLGVAVGLEANDSTNIVVKNGLTQHNWIAKNRDKGMFTGDLSTAFNLVFSSATNGCQFSLNGDTFINTGIVWLNDNPLITGLPNNYTGASVSYMGATGYVHSVSNSAYTLKAEDLVAPVYVPEAQGAFVPSFTFTKPANYDDTLKKVSLSYEQGSGGVTFNPAGVYAATKYGKALNITVTMNGTDYTGKTINFNVPGDYIITYTAVDVHVYDKDGLKTNTNLTFTKELKITVTETIPQIPDPTFKFFDVDGKEYTGKVVEIGGKKYVMPDVTGVTSGKIESKTISGQTVYFPVVKSDWKTGGMFDSDSVYRYYALYRGINITKWTSPTASVVYNSSYNGMDGITWISGGNHGGKDFSGYENNSSYGGYCRVTNAIKASGTNGKTLEVAGKDNVVSFSFECNGQTYYYFIGYQIVAEASSGC